MKEKAKKDLEEEDSPHGFQQWSVVVIQDACIWNFVLMHRISYQCRSGSYTKFNLYT